nr:3363_t:CDS:2 [Entrophospora candida]
MQAQSWRKVWVVICYAFSHELIKKFLRLFQWDIRVPKLPSKIRRDSFIVPEFSSTIAKPKVKKSRPQLHYKIKRSFAVPEKHVEKEKIKQRHEKWKKKFEPFSTQPKKKPKKTKSSTKATSEQIDNNHMIIDSNIINNKKADTNKKGQDITSNIIDSSDNSSNSNNSNNNNNNDNNNNSSDKDDSTASNMKIAGSLKKKKKNKKSKNKNKNNDDVLSTTLKIKPIKSIKAREKIK